MAKRKPSARTERRAAERAADKLGRDREKLARLEAGGSPARPIDVESASQVEAHALGMPCLRCDGAQRLLEHAAEVVDGARLRVVRMQCARCGTRRDAWFHIAPMLPS